MCIEDHHLQMHTTLIKISAHPQAFGLVTEILEPALPSVLTVDIYWWVHLQPAIQKAITEAIGQKI